MRSTPILSILVFLPLAILACRGETSDTGGEPDSGVEPTAPTGDAGPDASTSPEPADAAACPPKEEVRSQSACTTERLSCASVELSFPDECHRFPGPNNPPSGCECLDGKWQCSKFAILCEAGAPPCPAPADVHAGAACAVATTCPASCATKAPGTCSCSIDGHWDCPALDCPVDVDAGAPDARP